MKDFKTLAVYTYTFETAVIKLLLDQEHIRFFFQNETTIGVFPFYSNALGGILLKVHIRDFDRAREILDRFNKTKSPLKIV